ncbi:MAG TPA: DCC1-like thiol-disulfide oxidoreductase family protein [Chthoniobacterales bacterium]|nr:DCC1-like thiol-disulfide oxidoreductase family protein [Chthoniobacterales bacterium]
MISELTETTERAEFIPFCGWIFFDEDCSFCRDLVLRFEPVYAKRGFHFEPLQREWVRDRLNLTAAQALEEMRVLTADGCVFGGADAVVFLARQLWWATPFAWLARVGFIHALLDRSYRWVAAHRTCAINRAPTPSIPARTRWLALLLLPLLALGAKPFVSAWVFMWAMAFAIFLGCKWLTLGIAVDRAARVCPFRAAAFLLAWPGMDAMRFLSPNLAPAVRRSALLKNTVLATVRILIGAILLFAIARRRSDPIVAGWIGMAGMVLILHFGLFALLSAGWRALRVDAAPIMDSPLRSTSIAEFWGRRWNGAFNDLALGLVFRPAARRVGVFGATLLAFGVSGLIHELVISLPAGAGYGLPTGYFLLQGLAVIAQRKAVVLRGAVSGWFFTILIVAGPAYWLFHPPFVNRVVHPFMQAIGAL